MLVNKYYSDGKENIEIVRGKLSAGSYFRFCLILSVSFALLYLCVSILGYVYERWFGDPETQIGFSDVWWILAIQFFGMLFGLFLSYPLYRLIVPRFFSQNFVFSGESESDL